MANKNKNELMAFGKVSIGIVFAAFAMAAAISLLVLHAGISKSHGAAIANRIADTLQLQLNQREARLLDQAMSASTSMSLSQLMEDGTDEEIAQEEAYLGELIPSAIRVRLFPLGTAQADPSADPPFSFTSKTMVNRVETGLATHPEAIKASTGWILGLAAPIATSSDEEVKGTLFVYLEMSALSDGLSGLLDGELRLAQSFGNTTNDILTLGGGGVAEGAITRPLHNTNWSLTYYPSPAVMNASISDPVEFLIPLVVFLVVALAGTAFGISSVLAKANADAARMANQITDIIKGDYVHLTDYNLRAFVELDANLHRLGKKDEKKPAVEKLNVTLQPKQKPREEMVDIEEIDQEDYEREMQEKAEKATKVDKPKPEAESAPADDTGLAEIFRAYDIRGVVNQTLTPAVIKQIGLAIGTEAGEIGEQTLIVAADGRVSSPAVLEKLIEGLTESGRDVINIGQVPTPVLYYATQNSEARSGVMVTASHNPADYNGFKIVLDGRTLVDEDIQRIYARIKAGDFSSGAGKVSEADITEDYIEAITDDVVVAQPLKIVIDCGNGIAGAIAPDLFANLGCDVTPLYCDVDGTFPNHHPDPMVPANLSDLVLMVKSEGADLGIAFDGDGDRLVAVTSKGEIVWPDRLLMLFAKDVVSRNPGSDVVYDVKCTRHLNSIISSFGGRPIICRSGHSFIKAKMIETGAALGGEMSGHICFGERWYGFDDGLYAAARLLEIVGSQSEGLDELLSQFPESVSTPEIHIAVEEASKFGIVARLVEDASFGDGTITTIDGLRVDFADGWGLVRASNTGPNLTLRFEADNGAGLKRIMELFREQLQAIDGSLDFNT